MSAGPTLGLRANAAQFALLVGLNALVGRRFRVGEVECIGVELCEPCSHLMSLTHAEVLRGMVHRAGLNADMLNDGEIAVGDPVVPL